MNFRNYLKAVSSKPLPYGINFKADGGKPLLWQMRFKADGSSKPSL